MLPHLLGELREDLGLEAAEEEGAQHFVQTLDDEHLLLLGEVDLLGRAGKGRGKPLLKVGDGFEDAREEKVEQRPQLGQRVLQRRARQQQAARARVVLLEHLRQLVVVVLHAVALVNDLDGVWRWRAG